MKRYKGLTLHHADTIASAKQAIASQYMRIGARSQYYISRSTTISDLATAVMPANCEWDPALPAAWVDNYLATHNGEWPRAIWAYDAGHSVFGHPVFVDDLLTMLVQEVESCTA